MKLALVADLMLEKPTGALSPAPPNLVRVSLRIKESRVTVDDYRRRRAAFPEILGIVPAGTHIEVTGIERNAYLGLDDWFEVTARFTSGPFSGRKVSLNWISAHGADGRSPLVDPRELTIID